MERDRGRSAPRASGSGLAKISLAVDDRDGGWLARAIVEELRDDQVNLAELDPAVPPEKPPLRLGGYVRRCNVL